jgi:hypothetical protein
MTGDDLARELAQAVEALTDTQHEDLVLAGVDRVDIALGMVGAAYGHVIGDRFEPHTDGKLAYCTPIRCHDPLTLESPVPASAVRVGDLVDIVYWHPEVPRRWALRTGAAECLGLIEPQYCGPEPVAVHRGVLGWFRAGCAGVVILTPDPWTVYRLLSQCAGGIVAEDERHAEELRAALEHPWARPKVFVREVRHAL